MDRRTRRELVQRLNHDGAHIAARFGLRYRAIQAERANVRRRYGVCYSDGTIRIRLFHAVTGQPLRYSSLVDTLCHELAHLRHFDHGPGFQAFYRRVLAFARHAGIYRPAERRTSAPPRAAEGVALRRPPGREVKPSPPLQLSLFG